MNKEVLEFTEKLESLLTDKSREEIISSLPVFMELNLKLGLSYNDLLFLADGLPEIFSVDSVVLSNNLDGLGEIYNIQGSEFKNLVLKQPQILLLNHSKFDYQVRLISVAFALSKKDAMRLMFIYPELISITKEQIIKQIEYLSGALNEYGLGVRKCLRQEPRLIFITGDQVESAKKVLMHKFTLSEAEVQEAAKRVPTLLFFSEQELKQKFDFYYPRYFIKRDFKEIVSVCPEFLTMKESVFIKKLSEVCQTFELDEKKGCELIRRFPHVLFFPSIKNKILGFSKISIGRTFVKTYPEICFSPEIGLPIKFIITRILGLDGRFSEIVKAETRLLISRFLFMQSYEIFEHEDLLLSEDEFFKKYKISSKVLKISYKFDQNELKNLCNYYLSKKDELPHFKNIVFPNFDSLINYVSNNLSENYVDTYAVCREEMNLTRGEYKVQNYLSSLGLQENEIGLILTKCPALIHYFEQDSKKIIDVFLKNGYDFEPIITKLFSRPDLFVYSQKDFEEINAETLKFEGRKIF